MLSLLRRRRWDQTINHKPVDCVATTFHHCHYFILVSICNCCVFWSKVLPCRQRHAVIHHFSFKLKCSAFDSCSSMTERVVTAAGIPLLLSKGCAFTCICTTQQLSKYEAQLRQILTFWSKLFKFRNAKIQLYVQGCLKWRVTCFSDDHVNFFSVGLEIGSNARKYNVGLETKHWCCREQRWGQLVGVAFTCAAVVLQWLWVWSLASGFGLIYKRDFLKVGVPGRLLPFVPWRCLWGGKGLLFGRFSPFWADNSASFCGSVQVLVGAESPKCCEMKFYLLSFAGGSGRAPFPALYRPAPCFGCSCHENGTAVPRGRAGAWPPPPFCIQARWVSSDGDAAFALVGPTAP